MKKDEWLEKMKKSNNCCECKSFDEGFECYAGRIQSENKFCEKFTKKSINKIGGR